MVCCDTAAVQSVVSIKQDLDKIIPVDSHKVFVIAGESGDRVQFSEFIIANVKLYALRNGTQLSTKAVANYARGEMAAALRKGPYYCNLLIAGFDEKVGPSLYWMDYLGTLAAIKTGGTGYGSYFALSLFDKLWHPDVTQDEALIMVEKAVAEVRQRCAIAPPKFLVKVVDKDGIRVVKSF